MARYSRKSTEVCQVLDLSQKSRRGPATLGSVAVCLHSLPCKMGVCQLLSLPALLAASGGQRSYCLRKVLANGSGIYLLSCVFFFLNFFPKVSIRVG